MPIRTMFTGYYTSTDFRSFLGGPHKNVKSGFYYIYVHILEK